MKKSNLLFFLFLNAVSFSFGVELWNGFTTDMTIEQITERVSELFVINRTYHREHTERYGTSIGYHYNSGPYDSYIAFHTNNPASPAITFYFKNNNLYIIQVCWGSDFQTLLTRHRSQFGNPFETKSSNSYPFSGSYTVTNNDYKWQNAGRYIFLTAKIYPTNYPPSSMDPVFSYFINRGIYDAWQAEINMEQRQREEAEQQRRRAASEGITF